MVEYYSVVKRKKTVPFAEMCMDLKTLTQSNRKEKNEYRIVTHICRIQKNGTMNLFTKQKWRCKWTEPTYRHQEWMQGMNREIGIDMYARLCIK